MGGGIASAAAQVSLYVSAVMGASGGAALAKTGDDAAGAAVGLGCRPLQMAFGHRALFAVSAPLAHRIVCRILWTGHE